MYSNIGIIAIVISLIMIFIIEPYICSKTLNHSKSRLIFALILTFLGAYLCLNDNTHKDDAQIFKYEYDKMNALITNAINAEKERLPIK